jgi:8-oxo-dGTP diphosphatase
LSTAPFALTAMVEVVAAVILRADGSFLLGQRPPGKVYAGYWEFPGGKVEAGEALAEALARELREELDIEVQRAYRWIVQRFVYPHAPVALNFFRVTQWRGEPRPLEDQALAWARVEDLGVSPLLPANGPVLRALALPAQLGVTCAAQIGQVQFLQRLNAALTRGLRMVMVREPGMPRPELEAFAREVIRCCRTFHARVVVNGDVALAATCGADGLHLPARDLMRMTQRPPAAMLCGASCHDQAELERAQLLGLDYALLGPVQTTPTHPGARALGWERFERLLTGCSIPVFAIGGMRMHDLEPAWHAGAHGIAMIRGAWDLDARI